MIDFKWQRGYRVAPECFGWNEADSLERAGHLHHNGEVSVSAIVDSLSSSQNALPVCLTTRKPNGLVSLLEMLDFYAREFTMMVDQLSHTGFVTGIGLCNQLWLDAFNDTLVKLRSHCVALELSFSVDQIDRIYATAKNYSHMKKGMPFNELSTLLIQLRQRIDDELMRRAFYAIQADRMDFYLFQEVDTGNEVGRRVRLKTVEEVYGPDVVARLGAACDDLHEAMCCLILRRNKACVFHLMRAVEVGVIKLAKLIGIQDHKPSWGSILGRLETIVLRTKHTDRTPDINTHFAFLERVLPEMQAVQRSWRNKVSHVEDRILPEGEYTDEITENIMASVRVFIAELAREIP